MLILHMPGPENSGPSIWESLLVSTSLYYCSNNKPTVLNSNSIIGIYSPMTTWGIPCSTIWTVPICHVILDCIKHGIPVYTLCTTVYPMDVISYPSRL